MSTTIAPTQLDAPSRAAADWLDRFDGALRSGDGAEAARLFAADGFWRDLISFTWNIKTMEGRDEITAMLDTVLPRVGPSGWTLSEPAPEEGGIVSAWITFETAEARGRGFLRLRDGLCWTLLTAITELKGFEEKRGPTRPMGVAHGVTPGRQSWRERREAETAALGVTEQPYVLIVGGGQGGLALGARLRRLEVPTLIVDAHARSGTSGAAATTRSACTTRSGTTTCPTSSSRRTGRSSRPRTRSPTGWKPTRKRWSWPSGTPPHAPRPALTRRRASGRSRSSATASR